MTFDIEMTPIGNGLAKCPCCQRPFRKKKQPKLSPRDKARASIMAGLRKPMPKATVYKQAATN
jgi:hypothetical protein